MIESMTIYIVALLMSLMSDVSLAQSANPFDSGSKTYISNTETAQKVSVAPLQAQVQILPFEIEPHQIAELRISVALPKGYKAYEDQFKVEILGVEGFKLAKATIAPLEEIFDKFSNRNRKVVINAANIIVPIEAPLTLNQNTDKLKVKLTYQACTDSYCLFPENIILDASFKFKGDVLPTTEKMEKYTSLLDMNFSNVISQGLVWAFVFVFIFGFLTSLTPCVFPMIPITIAVLGKEAHVRSKSQNFLVSVIYVLGIATTYSALGVVAASTGALFGSFMTHPIVLSIVCLVFVVMALGMFGVFILEVPQSLRDGPLSHLKLSGYSGAFISGLIAGIVASPCVGPVLVGVLTFVAQTQNLWLGFWLLFVYALGMGLLFIALGVSSQITKLLPKSGAWMDSIKNFFGLLMLGAFFYYWNLLVPQRVFDFTLGICLLALGSLWGAFKPVSKPLPSNYLLKGFMQMFILLGSAFIIVSVFNLRASATSPQWIQTEIKVQNLKWQPLTETSLQEALKSGKPVFIDFFADWCAACHELDQYTFTDAQVQLLAEQFVVFRFDATKDSQELNAFKKTYGIVGLPSVVFYNKSGQWLKDQTLTEFEKPANFVERMKRALKL